MMVTQELSDALGYANQALNLATSGDRSLKQA
jgi:hypothetical protein